MLVNKSSLTSQPHLAGLAQPWQVPLVSPSLRVLVERRWFSAQGNNLQLEAMLPELPVPLLGLRGGSGSRKPD